MWSSRWSPHSRGSRPAILAHRPAPIQVNGGPAGYSVGSISIFDYIIGDAWTLPFSDQPYFSEQYRSHLPHTCYRHDSSQKFRAYPSRADEGLPERGLYFAPFNTSYKVTPEFFAVWMRLLREIDGSVLRLARNNDPAVANLRRAATEAGVDPSRLVFAQVRPAIEDHLARHQLRIWFWTRCRTMHNRHRWMRYGRGCRC